MKIIELGILDQPPEDFTGIVRDANADWYFRDGRQHRFDGPAIIRTEAFMESNLHSTKHAYCLEDILMKKEEWEEITRPMRTSLGKLIWKY